jgi:hypothetical protein
VGRELWEIGKIWWFVVPGGALGIVAIVHAVKGTPDKSVWFWGFWTAVAVCMAMSWRLWKVLKERDDARAELASENTRDAVARRIDGFALELETLRSEMPPDNEGVGPVVTDDQRNWSFSVTHTEEQISSYLRQNAPGFVSYWRESLNPAPRLIPFSARVNAEVDFALGQLHHIAQRLREGHDGPDNPAKAVLGPRG